jgi:hypothetical protein
VEEDQVLDPVDRVVERHQAGQIVLVHKVDWVDLTNTSHLIMMAIMDTMDRTDTLDRTDTTDTADGWANPGIGGADMVIGVAGTAFGLAGGGIPGIAIPIGGGTEIIGGAGYPAGAPILIHTDLTTIGNP